MKLKGYAGRFGVIVLTTVYLFISASHLFLAPFFRTDFIPRHNFVLKRNDDGNTQLIYNLIRTNRCMSKDNKTIKALAKDQRAIAIPVIHLKPVSTVIHLFTFQPDHHSSWLSNRTLRI